MNFPATARPRIGISACFFHADPNRPVFTGKTLQYVEQSIVHWVQSAGALAVVIPSPDGPTKRGDVTLADYAAMLDGLVLEGGSDMWPGSYGEAPLRPEWTGDRVRDDYEIALLRAFIDARRPVLGVCRGLQVLNVAFGGTLYQDIGTQRPGTHAHRDAGLYDQNFHTVDLIAGSRLSNLYPGVSPRDGQQRPSPGREGPRTRVRRRSRVVGRRHRRGVPLDRAVVRRGGAVAPGVPRLDAYPTCCPAIPCSPTSCRPPELPATKAPESGSDPDFTCDHAEHPQPRERPRDRRTAEGHGRVGGGEVPRRARASSRSGPRRRSRHGSRRSSASARRSCARPSAWRRSSLRKSASRSSSRATN